MLMSAPEKANNNYAFDLDEQGVKQWLDALPNDEPYKSGEAIYHMVQALNGEIIEPVTKARIFEIITEQEIKIENQLQDAYLKSSLPLGKWEFEIVEMLIWLNYELAKGYADAANQTNGISKKKWTSILIYHALSSLNRAFLILCEVYCKPFEGFWRLSYQLFEKAEQENLLDVAIPRQRQTIEDIFKHILILEMCGTNQYRNRHINMISNTLLKNIKKAKISEAIQPKYMQSYCTFDINSDDPPHRIFHSGYEHGDSIRFITSVVMARKIYADLKRNVTKNQSTSSVKQKILKNVVNTLGMSQQRKSERTKIGLECTGIVGLKQIIKYLRLEKKDQKEQSNAEILLTSVITPFSTENNSRDVGVSFCDVEILNSSPQGRKIICKSNHVQIKNGEIIGIYIDFSKRVELGLICRLENIDNEKFGLGIKMLSLETKLTFIRSASKNDIVIRALFLPGTKSIQKNDCVLFRSKHFKSGDEVILHHGDRRQIGRLGKILHQTGSIIHAAFIPE